MNERSNSKRPRGRPRRPKPKDLPPRSRLSLSLIQRAIAKLAAPVDNSDESNAGLTAQRAVPRAGPLTSVVCSDSSEVSLVGARTYPFRPLDS